MTPKALGILICLMRILSLCNFLVGRFAWNRLNSALKSDREEQRAPPRSRMQTIPGVEPAALPPRSAVNSVTAGTTELLYTQHRKAEAVRVRRDGGDTDAIN